MGAQSAGRSSAVTPFFLSMVYRLTCSATGTVASLGSGIRKKVRGFWAVGYGSWQWGTWTGSERGGWGAWRCCTFLGGQDPSKGGVHEGWVGERTSPGGSCRTRRGKKQSTQSPRRTRAAARGSGEAPRPRGAGGKRRRVWGAERGGRRGGGRGSGRSCASRPRPRRWRTTLSPAAGFFDPSWAAGLLDG